MKTLDRYFAGEFHNHAGSLIGYYEQLAKIHKALKEELETNLLPEDIETELWDMSSEDEKGISGICYTYKRYADLLTRTYNAGASHAYKTAE